jgi:hypothetical protein
MQDRFPNLKIAYSPAALTPDTPPSPLNPGPHDYESGFAVKWLRFRTRRMEVSRTSVWAARDWRRPRRIIVACRPRVARDVDRDYIMSAEQAMEYGMIDRVISSRELAPIPVSKI